SAEARILRDWLLTLLPGPNIPDGDELMFAWVRRSDGEIVRRHLDLRELTPQNQKIFYGAAKAAGKKAQSYSSEWPDSLLRECLIHLAEMVEKAERGEDPLLDSMWTSIQPSEGRKMGPGW